MAFLVPISLVSPAEYISLIRWVSQAVRPTKTTTPITEMANCSALEAMKMLTRLASTMPISPMNMKLPMAARSRLVV